ncbi:hypothetical protein DNL40_02670 [Xylanimonas oleitrophica]|uniref:HTH cro/C1-type domain-containing protein n=1 Tax=Xylanimonas oleitrophica TaxID=2607479 RepID=A0A2W5WX91_9MICO|nr:hypothetical protein [Xylanimonas oleitrophica]PZR55293.1 hypothetical protein DNL40_02670 [Xylanimonas oleitrophica]
MPEATPEGRARARHAVDAAITERGVSRTRAAALAGVADVTVLRFLNGDQWPRTQPLAKIERWLGWPVGSINRIAEGGAVPDSPEAATESGRIALPAAAADYQDLTESELAEAITAAHATFMERARTIRATRPRA